MAAETPWYEVVSIPALLRHARYTYGTAMREALKAAGHGDIPKNGLYVIGGLALGAGDAPLSVLIRDLRISKQAAGQLVDTPDERGHPERAQDPEDRRRQVVALTARGRAAAEAQSAATKRIDAELAERVGETAPGKLRKLLAVLVGIGRENGRQA